MENVPHKLFAFPEVRVVEASAGSGKTYALARRYVQLLINPSLPAGEIPLRHILAITFTNKATVEMKERILEFLKKIALDRFANADERNDILSSLGLPAADARQRAFYVMDHLVRNYNFFQVQTIDSFVNAIVAGCAFALHLSSRFEIQTGYRDYLAYSLDAVIERAAKEPPVRALFKDFLAQYLHVENKPGWFPKKNILMLADGLYNVANTYGGEFVTYAVTGQDDILTLKKDILEKMRQLGNRLPGDTNKKFAAGFALFVEKHRETFSVDELSAYFTHEDFPVNKGGTVPEETKRLWDAIRFGITALCRREAYAFYNCYIDIFRLVADDCRELSRRNDVLFLPELNRRASELFAGGAVSVPELYYRLATRFTHFLIDEFQDTSALQWKNLLPLVEEALSSGGSLFYVGDKKQAIYRFRGGDTTLFDYIPRSFAGFPAAREVLGKNYRSHKEIIAFNNEVFSKDNLLRFMGALGEEAKDDEGLAPADIAEILQVFSDVQQTGRPENRHGYVRVEHIEGTTVEERNGAMRGKLSALMKELSGRYAWRDIAFLVRDNSDVELFTGWLLEEKVPVESEKTLNVRENALVKELISFLSFLNAPIDSLAFASFITGSLFLGATGLNAETVAAFLFCRHRQGTAGGYLYRDFRETYRALWDAYVEEFFVNAGYVPLYELVVSILGRYDAMERFPGHQAFIMRFLEIVKEQEKNGSGIAAFLEYFKEADDKELFVSIAETDAVRVLTIHKSKGLEFPVVVIPFLEMQPGGGGRNGAASFEIIDGAAGLSLVRLSKKHARYCDDLRKLYADKYRRSFVDELDTVYVALTRARSELYAYVPERASSARNPVRLLIPAGVERGSKQQVSPSVRPPQGLLEVPAARYENWITLLKDEFGDDAGVKNRAQAQRGEFLHYALAQLGNLYDRDAARECKKAAEKANAFYPRRHDHAALEGMLHRIVDGAAARPFFFVEDGAVHQEVEVVSRAGATRRIDRLIVTAHAVTVVDYKSSREGREKHWEQVREYVRILGDLYPRHTLQGFILYLDDGGVEEVPA